MDIETAIKLYTKNAAVITGLKNAGQLRAGYHADFAVLSEDILTVAPEDIDKVKVEQTYIDGQRVFG